MNCHSTIVCSISFFPFVGMASTNQDANDDCTQRKDPESSGRKYHSLPSRDHLNSRESRRFMEMQFMPIQDGYHSSPLLSDSSDQQGESIAVGDVASKLESYEATRSSLHESSVATPKPRHVKSRIPVFSNMDYQSCSDIGDDPISHPSVMSELARSSFSMRFFQSYHEQHDHFSRRSLRRNQSLDNLTTSSFTTCNCSTSSCHGRCFRVG